MTNLNNYVNLSALGLPEVEASGVTFAPLGAGSGMIGLPGDFTPPSRFVRAVAFSQTARETEGGFDTIREAFRILDNFNIPADAAEGAQDDVQSDDLLYSATQVTTVKSENCWIILRRLDPLRLVFQDRFGPCIPDQVHP